MPDEALVGMRRRVAAMQRDGQILAGRKGALMLVSRIDLIPGKVSGHRDGFGFMLPDDGSPDIFLPPREMARVMHGDRVLVRRIGADSRGRPEGKIVEITLRNPRLVVGRLVSERGVLMLAPEDQRIKHDILIEPGGAGGAQPGQVVSAVIIEPPGWNKPPIARVTEVLGSMDDAGMEIEIAVRKFDVPHRFPDDVLAEADALPDTLRPADYRNRVDLRDVALVTIDGEDARDFDDAVYCEAVSRCPRPAEGLAPAGGHCRCQPLCAPRQCTGCRGAGAHHLGVFPASGHSHAAREALQRAVLDQPGGGPAGAGGRHGDRH